MPKLSIVCTYYQRQVQLNKTLESFKRYNSDDFNVIIVDDASPEDIVLPELSFEVIILKLSNKTWTNPEPAYNLGIKRALEFNPEIIILQNAECYHVGNVLDIAKTVTSENYIAFGCFSLSEENTFREHDIFDIIAKNNIGATENGDNVWYNHSVHRPIAYDFCIAITVENLIKLNGYDERFSSGIAYGDDYLIARVRMLGLKVDIIDDPFVVHQWHSKGFNNVDQQALTQRNLDLLNQLIPLGVYRAEHLITPDL